MTKYLKVQSLATDITGVNTIILITHEGLISKLNSHDSCFSLNKLPEEESCLSRSSAMCCESLQVSDWTLIRQGENLMSDKHNRTTQTTQTSVVLHEGE